MIACTLIKDHPARGTMSLAAKGIHNAIGFYFDVGRNQDHLIFTTIGSDRAADVLGATPADNVPDCTVEVLPLDTEAPPPTKNGKTPKTPKQQRGQRGLFGLIYFADICCLLLPSGRKRQHVYILLMLILVDHKGGTHFISFFS